MLTPQQIATAKLVWETNLRLHVAKWSANPDLYVQNKTNLALDDVIDIVKGAWKSTRFPAKKEHKLQELYLDNDGNIPLDFQLNLSAIQALAAERGIDIRSDIDFEDDTVVVLWNIVSISGEGLRFVETYQSQPIIRSGSNKLEEMEKELKEAKEEGEAES